jgi:pimeloyl-ACP methyl ester carboxylesterase
MVPTPLQKVRVQGHQLAFQRQGQGPPVLLVHGITTASFIWRRLAAGLARDFDVVAVDLLGCGDSDMPLAEDFGIRRQVELLEALAGELGFDRFAMIGHDIGGGITQRFAVDHPERLRAAVVVNGVAYDYWPVQPIIAMRTPIVRQLAMATLDLGALQLIVKRGLFHRDRATPELMDLFFRQMRTALGRKSFLHFAACLDNQDLTSIAGALQQTRVPFLVIRGMDDVYLSGEIALRLHREIPASELLEIAEAGHFIQEDQPERLLAAFRDFLGRQP